MWPNLQETADLVTFIKEIFNGKLHFLYSIIRGSQSRSQEFLALHKYIYRVNKIVERMENLIILKGINS